MSGFALLHSAHEWNERFARRSLRSVVSVGNFDGLHLGHQKILREVVERAGAAGNVATVITFDPHPLKVLRPEQAPLLVQTLKQRIEGFRAAGIEAVVVQPFTPALAAVTAGAFVHDLLVGELHVAEILVGENFRFGSRQSGNISLLAEMGRQLGFAVDIVEPVRLDGVLVSSTLVRTAIANGSVAEAARLLARPFALTGEIVRGEGRGSSILVPTLNLKAEQELLPKPGVYATEALVAGNLYRAATNVGFRPTFNGTHLSVESHVFDFAEAVTSGRMEVRFRERLRDERKFGGPAELLEQIGRDLEQARTYFRGVSPPALRTV